VRVLITGGRAPVALDLARRFAASGAEVFVADSAPCFLAGSSRSVRRAFRVPAPRSQPQEFADAIAAIAREQRIDLIVPTCEEVFYLARFAAQLSRCAPLFCPDFAVLEQLHDKWRFTQLAARLGIDVPESWLLREPRDLGALPLPARALVFKPVFSRFAVHTLVRPSLHALARIQLSPQRPWLAQRFVGGSELCTYSVARDGALRAHVTYRPRWRAGTVGSSYYFEPLARPAVERTVAEIVAALSYTGQISLDFIETPDGRIVALECNPRATSGLHLFGPSDPLPAAFNGVAAPTARPTNGRPSMLAPAMAVLGAPRALRTGQLLRLAADFRAARDAIWSRDDPFPSLYLYFGLGAFVALGVLHGISPVTASTRDIEWDGEPIA
jgi:glutathione synthase/RimK-type ligase-like ATP-grasp enzyme